MLKCLMCNNCIVALHQRNRFEISEMIIRRLNRLSFWKSNFAIDSIKFESFIAIYRFLFIRSELYWSFDRSLDKKWYFVRRTNIISIEFSFKFFSILSFATRKLIIRITRIVFLINKNHVSINEIFDIFIVDVKKQLKIDRLKILSSSLSKVYIFFKFDFQKRRRMKTHSRFIIFCWFVDWWQYIKNKTFEYVVVDDVMTILVARNFKTIILKKISLTFSNIYRWLCRIACCLIFINWKCFI